MGIVVYMVTVRNIGEAVFFALEGLAISCCLPVRVIDVR